ncbi:MAG: hypothetical protein COX96_01530 [Candidatus Omnitrophica bacterium CG_4_10_14_0_2_um_filter_44_9]|nr:MAG: hypothetical protein COY78_05260 [Candidatus Omnitrophica bacterium CG_4_10_14_0_8_um_filter_44_12]PIZ84841.1 MAG: hypothetical protein COX96_01530 [Candidatus Omnitrophica bacterium CG_4_10_14_0_2_um_filter_44_9]
MIEKRISAILDTFRISVSAKKWRMTIRKRRSDKKNICTRRRWKASGIAKPPVLIRHSMPSRTNIIKMAALSHSPKPRGIF